MPSATAGGSWRIGDTIRMDVRIRVPIASKKVKRNEAKRVRGKAVEELSAGISLGWRVNISQPKAKRRKLDGSEKNTVVEGDRRINEIEVARQEDAEVRCPERWRTPFPGPLVGIGDGGVGFLKANDVEVESPKEAKKIATACWSGDALNVEGSHLKRAGELLTWWG